MIDHPSVRDSRLISTERAEEDIAHALNLAMGEGRKFSFADVEQATGIKASTLYSYVRTEQRRHVPSPELVRLCQFFGPEFTSKILDSTGQRAAWRDPRPGEPGYVIARLAQGTGEFAWRGSDHIFCHSDRAKLEPVADEMIQILTPFASRREG